MGVYIQMTISQAGKSFAPQIGPDSSIRLANKLRAMAYGDGAFLVRADCPYRDLMANAVSRINGTLKFIDRIGCDRSGAYGIEVRRDLNHEERHGEARVPITTSIFIIDKPDQTTLCDLIDIARVGSPQVVDICNQTTCVIDSAEQIKDFLASPIDEYLCPDSIIPNNMKEELLGEYIPSDEVASFLAATPLTKRQAIMLILGSDKTVAQKASTIARYGKYDDPLHELVDEATSKRVGFSTYSAWERVVKWSFGEWSKKLSQIIAEAKDECVYVKGYGDLLEGTAYFDVPLPFHCGDIVSLDCRPYGQMCNGVVLHDGNGSASSPIVYRSKDDRWTLSRINIGRRWGDEHSALSPIYRMCKQSELLVGENLLSQLSEFIGGDPAVARQLWSAIIRKGAEREISESLLSSMMKAS